MIEGVLITCAEGTALAEIAERIHAAAFLDWADTVCFMEETRIEAAARVSALMDTN